MFIFTLFLFRNKQHHSIDHLSSQNTTRKLDSQNLSHSLSQVYGVLARFPFGAGHTCGLLGLGHLSFGFGEGVVFGFLLGAGIRSKSTGISSPSSSAISWIAEIVAFKESTVVLLKADIQYSTMEGFIRLHIVI